MRFKLPKNKTYKDIQVWHKWFAWHPIKINDYWFWFQCVERKGVIYTYNLGGVLNETNITWEYKELGK